MRINPLSLSRLALLAAALALTLVAWLAFSGNNNWLFRWVSSVPYGDKLGHFCVYAGLTMLAILASNYATVRRAWPWLYWASLGCIALASIDELSQGLSVNRTLDVNDFLANLAGIASATILCFVWQLTRLRRISCEP
ncbi:VanZ family protein [Paraferrimonas sedimenticola]|uniref:VanZ-like domain-containing protein n=1 Tax=Paraferrimonas sedimenticola TaxID=375674 RepID=A0AA37W033_9GAMM|nr:VanZ family protein [Paraferrimonas sedimenticola]GLP94858.1 hypothetical protein GCM10007895_01640 [Paraferrimonas sedimenticola]